MCSSEPKRRVDSFAPSGTYGQHRADKLVTTGSARARLPYGLKLDDFGTVMSGSYWRRRSTAFLCQTASPILRDWSCTKYSRQRRHVQRRFAAKNAPAGQRQIRTISVRRIQRGNKTITSLRRPPPAAPARTASGGSWSTRPVALTSFGFIVGLCRFRRLGLGVVRLRQFPSRHAL